MAVAIALWSLDLKPGKEVILTPPGDIRISNAALGEELTNQNGRTLVKLTYNRLDANDSDEEDEDADREKEIISSLILCSLTAGKIENAQVSLILEESMTYKFELLGENPVSLSGNYIDQNGPDQPPYGSEDDFDSENDDEDEDAYDLREVSSDVEVDPAELDGLESDGSRFEEVGESEPAKPAKRPRESDVSEKDDKAAKPGKKNKKMKKDNGEAAPAPAAEAKAKPAEKKEEKPQGKGEKKAEKAVKERELEGGLKIKDFVTGTGPQAKKGDKLQMRYIGKLENGKVFDKNVKGSPFVFRLGDGQVIKGWDIGLVGMQVGGERILTIPPKLAYGKKGSKPEIPPNATLTFEVKLLAIN